MLSLTLFLCSHTTKKSCQDTERQGGYVQLSKEALSSVAQSCLTLCNPTDHIMPGLPAHHQLLYSNSCPLLNDAIQPSHPLSSPSPPALNLSHIRVFSSESALRIRQPKYWSFSFKISPYNEHSGLISLQSKGLSRVFSNTTVEKHQLFGAQLPLQFNSHIHT